MKSGNFEERMLARRISQTIEKIRMFPNRSPHIPNELWPDEYKEKYHITNLWKRDLGGDWRLIYTIDSNAIEVVSIILEWMDHKHYNRKFRYEN